MNTETAPQQAGTGAGRPAGPLAFARMTGSSIAGRDAAPWVTDFLNAAYYRRPVTDRDVDDLRLAFCVLTTYWYRKAPRAGCTSPTSPPSTAPSPRIASTRRCPAGAPSIAPSCWTAPPR